MEGLVCRRQLDAMRTLIAVLSVCLMMACGQALPKSEVRVRFPVAAP